MVDNDGSGMTSSLQVPRRHVAGCYRPSQCKMQCHGLRFAQAGVPQYELNFTSAEERVMVLGFEPSPKRDQQLSKLKCRK
jgi:hypothetical protein